MNFIHQEREEVIKLNNIAQTQIVDILKNIDSVNTIDLNVNMPLSGDLDLSVLEDYKQLRNIMFTEGRITSIRNIPEKIQKIEISKNLLIDLENLPKGLLHLDINDNYLKFLDLSYLDQLEVLYCENNKLTEVKLPKSIIECYLTNNDVKHLDLKDFTELKVLHISNNPLIVVENKDTINLREYECDNNPLVNLESDTFITGDDIDDTPIKKVEYREALNMYFKMKSSYEEKVKKEKKDLIKTMGKSNLKNYQPKCIKCKKQGGTIFKIENNTYICHCGNRANPCNLNIKLLRGDYVLDGQEVISSSMQTLVNQHKEDIIKQKLDTLLNFISEQESSKKFKEKMQEFNDDSLLLNESLKDYNELYNNSIREASINKKIELTENIKENMKNMLNEYNKTNNKEILRTLLNLYMKELIPEQNNLQNLKYEMQEVIIENLKSSDNSEMFLNTLVQMEVDIIKRTTLYGDPPKIIKYQV